MGQGRTIFDRRTRLPRIASGSASSTEIGDAAWTMTAFGFAVRIFSRTRATFSSLAVSILLMTTTSAIRRLVSPGMKSQFVPGPVGIGHNEKKVGLKKRHVVIAAIPDHDFRFFFGASQYFFIVCSRINDRPAGKMRLVFFALFDRDVCFRQISPSWRTFAPLAWPARRTAWMAHDDDAFAHFL